MKINRAIGSLILASITLSAVLSAGPSKAAEPVGGFLRTFHGCVGEHVASLPQPCDVHLACGAFRRAGAALEKVMVAAACGSGTTPYTYTFRTLSIRSGNSCGYGHFEIVCVFNA